MKVRRERVTLPIRPITTAKFPTRTATAPQARTTRQRASPRAPLLVPHQRCRLAPLHRRRHSLPHRFGRAAEGAENRDEGKREGEESISADEEADGSASNGAGEVGGHNGRYLPSEGAAE